ncbi:MAG: hypothetical protein NC308_11145 [Clostridium sp.]|nr:hypothetical protein [Bacteroides sp.]MCM1199432.1 hypothetical protein [Clostridium sp.]
MKRALFLISFIILLTCCHNARRQYAATDKDISIDKTLMVLKSKRLQDSLYAFTKRIDSIPNSYGAPLVYMVIVQKEQKDTTLEFIANWSLLEEVLLDGTDALELHPLGACRLEGKTIVVYAKNIDVAQMINEECLTYDDYNFFENYDGPLYCDRSWYPLSSRKYRLVNKDSLSLLKISRNKYEH